MRDPSLGSLGRRDFQAPLRQAENPLPKESPVASHVVVHELLRRGMKRTVESGDYDVDSKDEDGCLELLAA
jgi:hypothetical protein